MQSAAVGAKLEASAVSCVKIRERSHYFSPGWLARENRWHGEDQVYNWVHPDNHKIIAFSAKRGYNVLNLIELRKPHPGEKLCQRIRVGEHEYNY